MTADVERLDPCRTCKRLLPVSQFYGNCRNRSGHASDCKRCYLAKRRNPNGKRRMPRFNAAGDAYCPHCTRYRDPSRFKPHPNRGPGYLWWCCRDCEPVLDKRRRMLRLLDEEAYARDLKRGTDRRRFLRSMAMVQRREELRAGIAALKANGWTRARIALELGAGYGSVIAWERGEVRHPRPSTVERLYALIGRESS